MCAETGIRRDVPNFGAISACIVRRPDEDRGRMGPAAMGYADKVKREIARWAETGLIDAATAGALGLDIERQSVRRISFGSVLAMMAAALLGAAILIFIAANWEAMPRLLRVGMLFAVILGGYLGGAILKARGRAGFGEALWVVAAAAFGGAIALIGQMYHLS